MGRGFPLPYPSPGPRPGGLLTKRWINRAQKLRTGDWLRDQEKPDEPQYIRLVWVARGFSRFVFVNHQGMRVVELELESLARQMRKGIIVPDSQYERPLVDESIESFDVALCFHFNTYFGKKTTVTRHVVIASVPTLTLIMLIAATVTRTVVTA